MNTALVIMAAGIGSRFGGGIKQLEQVGTNGEIIMDYSVHDAIEAGFNKVIFIIRKDIEKDFKEIIGNRIEAVGADLGVEIAYAFQDPYDLPAGVAFPEGRTKPWGTGQAVLACRDLVHEPFAVINADDYYGKEAFRQIHDFLIRYTPEQADAYCMAGFFLKNTLSDNGGVTRGICRVDENGFLTGVDETKNIVKTAGGAEADGQVVDPESYVSMNMWGFTPEFMERLKMGFVSFFEEMKAEDAMSAEYLIPIYVDELLQKNAVSVRVLETQDKWFGMTYQEDVGTVKAAFRELIEKGVYREELYGDLK